jgi:hypothetical protein
VALWWEAGRWWATGTPLRGREGRATQLGAWPLGRLVALSPHAETLAWSAWSPAETLSELLRRVCLDADPAVPSLVRDRLLGTAAALSEAIPGFALASGLGHDVAMRLEAERVKGPLLRDAAGASDV